MFDGDIQKSCAPNQRCPFGVDLRVLIKKRLSGDFFGAYEYYRSKVIFPEVVSRTCSKPCLIHGCQTVKKHRQLVMDIEKTCANVKYEASSLKAIPHKWKTAAVIGGGIGGMACAILLANKGYDVDLYEKTDALGGSLKSQLSARILEKEFYNPSILMNIRVLYHRRIDNMEICDKYDVVCNTVKEKWAFDERRNLFHALGDSIENRIASAISSVKEIEQYLDGVQKI